MSNIVLRILLVLSPICYLSGVPLAVFDTQFFYIGTAALFVASLFDKPIRKMPTWEIATLIGICLFNLFMNGLNPRVFNSFINILFACVAFRIVVTYCDLKDWYKYAVIGVVLNLLIVILESAGICHVFGGTEEPGGLMGNAPRLMSYLTIMLPIMPWFLIPICVLFAIILKEYTLLAVASFVLWTKDKVFGLFLLLAGFFHEEILTSFSLRVKMWGEVLTPFLTRPMLGYGLGVNPYGPDTTGRVGEFFLFNDYLSFITGVGVLGAVWLFFVVGGLLRRMGKDRESLCLMGLLILSTVEYPFCIERLWFTIITIIAAFTIRRHYGSCKVLAKR